MQDESSVGRWLLLLRDGTETEQQLARTELGLILEARGLLDEAAEAFERCVAEGTTDRRPYERLAAIARQRGDTVAEARALRGLAELLSPTPPPDPAVVPGDLTPPAPLRGANIGFADIISGAERREDSEVVVDAADDGPDHEAVHPAESAGDEPLHDASVAEPEPAAEPVPESEPASVEVAPAAEPVAAAESASDDERSEPDPAVEFAPDDNVPEPSADVASVSAVEATAAPDSTSGSPILPLRPDPSLVAEDRTDLDGSPLSRAQGEGGRGVRASSDFSTDANVGTQTLPAHAPTSRAGFSRLLPTLIGLVLVIAVVGGALMVPVSRPLGIGASTPAPSPRAITQPLVAVEPTALPSPSPSPTVLNTQTPVAQAPAPSPTNAPAPVAARCADAALRFPESRDSETAVRGAFREYMARQGVTIDPASTLFAGLAEAHAARHAEVMAGWMAVTLQRERRGLPTFPLVDYVASDIIVAAGPGEYQLRATISPQGWNELRALPPESCEGAFLASPENARWVEQMPASVGDITWALPTPQPRP